MPATNVNWPTPLTRLNPWYPGQFGVPGTDSETGLRLNTEGAIFWVDPNHPDPNDQRDGTNPTSPLATVEAALTKCQPYRGDTIAVMHNGYWTYGDTTESNITPIQETVVIDVPGIRLVGISPSGLGVPWTGSANNDVLITVHALDVLIEGFNFWDSTHTGVTGILAEWDSPDYFGENLTVRHCFFYDIAYGIALDYSWNDHIEDCSFQECSTAAIHNPSVYGEPDYLTIRNCVFKSDVGGALLSINLPACDGCIIEGNIIQNNPAGIANMINLTGGAGNMVVNNTLSCTLAQYAATTCEDATSGSWGFNHCENGDTTAAP